MRILIVEDERRIAQAVKEGLEQEAFTVDVSYDGEAGYVKAVAGTYDVIVLDAMVPGMDGMAVCRKLRAEGNETPVLMLTAKNREADIIQGLDSGANDYLAKPFSFDVLLARIRALLRNPPELAAEVLAAGGLTLDPVNHHVERDGRTVKLSGKEYAIMEYLLRNKGRVLSKHNIMTHVWNFDANMLSNNVEVFIAYLRAKVDKPFAGPNIIHTVRGFGYKVDG